MDRRGQACRGRILSDQREAAEREFPLAQPCTFGPVDGVLVGGRPLLRLAQVRAGALGLWACTEGHLEFRTCLAGHEHSGAAVTALEPVGPVWEADAFSKTLAVVGASLTLGSVLSIPGAWDSAEEPAGTCVKYQMINGFSRAGRATLCCCGHAGM